VGFLRRILEEEALHLENWLKNQFHGEMKYMENHFDKRLDPRLLVEGQICDLSKLYYFRKLQNENFKISKYAYGEDYHEVIKEKLRSLVAELRMRLGNFFSCFCRFGAGFGKSLGPEIGIGWVGKIKPDHQKYGSFYFLAEIICDLDLVEDSPVTDHCGSCTKCIDVSDSCHHFR
jgi:epoxyqueuosine reductase